MKKLLTIIIALAVLTVTPMGIIAQNMEPPQDMTAEEMNSAIPLPYYGPGPGGFDYSYGIANGTYVDFELDETTGTVSDYTVRFINYDYYYPMTYYDDSEAMPGDGYMEPPVMPVPEEMNTTLFDSIEIDNFTANGHPASFGESLAYLGENVMMNFYDSDFASASYQFGAGNGTMTLGVADGLDISETPYYWELYDLNASEMSDMVVWEESQFDDGTDPESIGVDGMPGEGGDIALDEPYYDPYFWNWDEVYLTGENFTCSIWVDHGTIDIDKANNTVIINTYKNAMVSFSAWLDMPYICDYAGEPWYGDLEDDDRGMVETAVENGLLAAIGYLTVNEAGEDWSDADTFNDPSFQMQFTNVEENKFDVEVESHIQEGRIVSINVNEGALDAQDISDIMVLMDDSKITACDSLEQLTDMQGGTEAGYYAVFGDTQTTIFVYVPHFSTHTISVQGIVGTIPNIIVPGVLAIAFVIVAVMAVVQRGKKGQDE